MDSVSPSLLPPLTPAGAMEIFFGKNFLKLVEVNTSCSWEWERGGGVAVPCAWSRRCCVVSSDRKPTPADVGGSQNTVTPIQLPPPVDVRRVGKSQREREKANILSQSFAGFAGRECPDSTWERPDCCGSTSCSSLHTESHLTFLQSCGRESCGRISVSLHPLCWSLHPLCWSR